MKDIYLAQEDYYYEIMDENDNVIDTDYVCLDSAIEYAEENGGVIINQVWYRIQTGEVVYSEIVWEQSR